MVSVNCTVKFFLDHVTSFHCAEIENSGVKSRRSISSISTSTQTLDLHGETRRASNPSEFVNHASAASTLLLFVKMKYCLESKMLKFLMRVLSFPGKPEERPTLAYELMAGCSRPFKNHHCS
ncbi:hypothetical protein MA16_Dca018736 [Dendrobium catenatum]|uniref:Uncharacterized protein n=1 Tax=Dendrobium catenatum TaxID=906689 RepID=A0A2I0VUA0_9ASPA|nr:hypothetical protein MA16_Dca018736 [Dendrobium catenatum]